MAARFTNQQTSEERRGRCVQSVQNCFRRLDPSNGNCGIEWLRWRHISSCNDAYTCTAVTASFGGFLQRQRSEP
jgi:hypothetical protein